MTSPAETIVADMPLLRELAQLRERSRRARRASAALADVVTWTQAHSQRSCAATRQACDRWREWRRGMDAARAVAEVGRRPHLDLCVECGSVRFAPPAAASRDRAAERWVEPPAAMRELLRDGWRGAALSQARCPGCERGTVAAGPADASARWLLDAGEVLRRAFAESGPTAEGRWGAPCRRGDIDGALARAAGELARVVPAHELPPLVEALHALAAELREGVRGDGSPEPAPMAARFRPPLRAR